MSKSPSPQALKRTEVLNCLWQYQRKHRKIRKKDIRECSEALGISHVELEGIISFYHFFHTTDAGKYTIYLNNSIVSEIKGFDRVKEAFEKETGASFGATDPGGHFGLFETSCIGLSDFEPAALINFYPFLNLNTLKVKSIISALKKGAKPMDICDEVPDNIRLVPEEKKSIFFRPYHLGSAVPKLQKTKAEKVIEEVKKAGIRGMGGAFFPTGIKWESCRAESAKPKYIVCNADEGEPGTFKDRALLTSMPGLVLEGMIIAGFAVGASEGIVYLRAEYTWLLEKLNKTISQLEKMGLLGKDILGIKGFDFSIRIQLGAGAYVCGEETALLNSLEGKRGEPRTKLYFPTQRGYLDKPTIVNNVETFAAAARVMELGSEHFLRSGTNKNPGTKLLSVSGDCRNPGIYEVEWGTKVKDVLKLCGAEAPNFIQVSGPSGQCITAKEGDRKIEVGDLVCGGSFMIFNKQRDILKILTNYSRFFKEESCGLCTPCRAGNFIIQRKLEKIGKKLAFQNDYNDIKEWGQVMGITSRCGLGKAATNSLLQALDKFPEYFDQLVDKEKEGLNRRFDLEAAVVEYDKFKN